MRGQQIVTRREMRTPESASHRRCEELTSILLPPTGLFENGMIEQPTGIQPIVYRGGQL